MKLFLMLFLSFCMMSASAQTPQGVKATRQIRTGDTYLFQKATFTVYNYNSKAVVDTRVIADPASLTVEDMYFRNIFRQVIISNGALVFCTLPDEKGYAVKADGIKLSPAKTVVLPKGSLQANDLPQNPSPQLEPYILSINNDVLTFSVDYLYGDSKYKFPLEGKLILTMIKQK